MHKQFDCFKYDKMYVAHLGKLFSTTILFKYVPLYQYTMNWAIYNLKIIFKFPVLYNVLFIYNGVHSDF